MAESYADEQRRRNGLTPAGYYVDECTVTAVGGRLHVTGEPPKQELTVQQPDHIRYVVTAYQPEPQHVPTWAEIEDVYATAEQHRARVRRAIARLADTYDLRCLHDLLPDMCHHCKET